MSWKKPEGILIGYVSEKGDKYLIEPVFIKKDLDKKGQVVIFDEAFNKKLKFKDEYGRRVEQEVRGNVVVKYKDLTTFFEVDRDLYWSLEGAVKSKNKGNIFWNLLRVFLLKNLKDKQVVVNELRLDFKNKYDTKNSLFYINKVKKKKGLITDWARG